MIENPEYRDQLAEYLSAYGIACDEQACVLMLRHLDLVVAKNEVMNLTRIVDPEDALVRHVVDSLLLLPMTTSLGVSSEGRFLDVGTGAGFPGIPLALATGMRGKLIDSVGKKVNAVSEFLDELGLAGRVTAQAVRAEELARKEPSTYDMVTARAVAELGVLVEYATPLLMMGGALVVSKANISDEEMSRGVATGKIVGMELVSRETYELPHNTGHREIIAFKRTRKSRIKLPRQTGAAKHKPLV